MKNGATARAGGEPCRVVVVGESCISEERVATTLARDKKYHVCSGAPCYYSALEAANKLPPQRTNGADVAVCRIIMATHRGKLWDTNNANCGATFHFGRPIRMSDGEVVVTNNL